MDVWKLTNSKSFTRQKIKFYELQILYSIQLYDQYLIVFPILIILSLIFKSKRDHFKSLSVGYITIENYFPRCRLKCLSLPYC